MKNIYLLLTLVGYVSSCCHKPTLLDHMKFKDDPKDSYILGDTVDYVCMPGYRKIGKLSTLKCTDNGWTRFKSRCVAKKCSNPGDINNGYANIEGLNFGAQVTYSCNSGYKLIGEESIYCIIGDDGNRMVWSNYPPICTSIQCVSPPSVPNSVQNSYEDSYNDKDAVTYTCNKGFSMVGDATIVCLNGEWSDFPPSCEDIKCKYPHVPNGYISRGFRSHFSYKDEVQFECNDGYSLSGSPTSTCDRGSKWNPELPTCS
ncbi:complement binding [NY_014 poxvirus]|uniref:complement binding n=1 Tax=NY_014 poxvirus TaxID=2025360 RepID=UPI000B9A03D9|nr:complement binding [NY_014 poxvirus]AST09420.1 complement binding [NY_014 poxvirus]